MELNKKAAGLTAGILWGLTVMLVTWFLLFVGSPGALISKIGVIYRGYSYSFIGGIVGLIWGFVDGFICGWLFAWIYNMFAASKKKVEGDEG